MAIGGCSKGTCWRLVVLIVSGVVGLVVVVWGVPTCSYTLSLLVCVQVGVPSFIYIRSSDRLYALCGGMSVFIQYSPCTRRMHVALVAASGGRRRRGGEGVMRLPKGVDIEMGLFRRKKVCHCHPHFTKRMVTPLVLWV